MKSFFIYYSYGSNKTLGSLKTAQLFLFFVLILTSAFSVNAQIGSLFTTVRQPVGVAVDKSNNVFISHDNVWNTVLAKYNSSGRLIRRTNWGGFGSIGQMVKMAMIPSTGYFLGIFPNGDFVIINPSTNTISVLGNLRNTSMNTSSIYDAHSGLFSNMGGSIQPFIADYGDIAVHQTGNNIYVFITGTSAGIPFVTKIRFYKGVYQYAKVVLSSSASDEFTSELPRGIAVNEDGLLLTTMPTRTRSLRFGFDAAVKFKYNFTSSSRPKFILNKTDIASEGMCTDKNGNFYIATGPKGTTLGGVNGSGAIVILSPSLTQVKQVITISSSLIVKTHDIAVNAKATRAYFTVGSLNSVYQLYLNKLGLKPEASEPEEIHLEFDETLVDLENPNMETLEDQADEFEQGEALSDLSLEHAYIPFLDPSEKEELFDQTITNTNLNTQINVFPNPTQDRVQIMVESEIPSDFMVILSDINGKILWNQDFNIQSRTLQTELDLSNYPTGTYIVQIKSNSKVETRSVIKR